MESLRIVMPPEMFAPAAYRHLEGEARIPVVKAGPDLYDFAEPLTWQGDVTNTGGALLVTGEVRGEAAPRAPAASRRSASRWQARSRGIS